MQKTIKCGVVGVGYLGRYHAEKYAALPNAELVAVCDINDQQLQEIAKKHNTEALNNYRDLVEKVDAVSIAVPTLRHNEIAQFFLQNKIHVLLEKPIASTVAEADELIALAKQNEVILQIGHLERFNPVVMKLRERLEKPLFIESLRIAPFKLRGTDINVVLDLMIHDIELIQHLIGYPISRIQACGAPVLSEHDDIANARIEFINGCVANVTASRISYKPKRELRIFQHNVYFSGDLHHKTLNIHRKGINLTSEGIPEILHETLVLNEQNDALLEEIKSFLNSITYNLPPAVSGEDGREALATAIKISKIMSEHWKLLNV
jgi:predicted dehydrogenase